MSRYQKGKTNLDFTEARSEWQWQQLGHMQVCTLLQTDNHANNCYTALTVEVSTHHVKLHQIHQELVTEVVTGTATSDACDLLLLLLLGLKTSPHHQNQAPLHSAI